MMICLTHFLTFPVAKLDPHDKVNASNFEILSLLGTGAYGRVYLVKKKDGVDKGQLYAMKVLEKVKVLQKKKTTEHTKTEREVSLKYSSIQNDRYINFNIIFLGSWEDSWMSVSSNNVLRISNGRETVLGTRIRARWRIIYASLQVGALSGAASSVLHCWNHHRLGTITQGSFGSLL